MPDRIASETYRPPSTPRHVDYDLGSTDELVQVSNLPQILTGVARGDYDYLIASGDDGSFLQSCAVTSLDGHLVLEWQHPDGDGRRHFRLLSMQRGVGGRLPNLASPGFEGDRVECAFAVAEAVAHFRAFHHYGRPAAGVYLEDMTHELFG